MKAIIKRELKNYVKNPIYWVGLVLVLAAVYQMLAHYLKIDYFKSDQEIRDMSVTTISDAGIMEGYIPSSPKQQIELGSERIRQTMIEDMGMSEEEADDITGRLKGMDIQEAARYLEKYGYYRAEYVFEDLEYHQGSMEEVNGYIDEKMQQHSYSYYFALFFGMLSLTISNLFQSIWMGIGGSLLIWIGLNSQACDRIWGKWNVFSFTFRDISKINDWSCLEG